LLVGHPTNKIGKFIDEHIKGYVPQVKTYVRDTQDFITKICQAPPFPPGTLLVTMDIVSLYTNIPNHEALVAISHYLRRNPTKKEIGPYILKLIELCLHNTNFQFHIIEDCNLLTDSNDPSSQRKRREMFWIWTLKTIHPYGTNMAI
jgi:hypothetical protein